jgi:hypothetical protein
MDILVETKDSKALSDSELVEMADVAGSKSAFDLGLIAKQKDDWVLVTRCWENNKLRAWSFFTLDRIGGTPAIVLGFGHLASYSKSQSILKHILIDQFKRAILSFPDEDLLVSARLTDLRAMCLFKGLVDIIPRPQYKPTGEERAWGRRLAKRYGLEKEFDDSEFVAKKSDGMTAFMEFYPPKYEAPSSYDLIFNKLKGDQIQIVWGWAMAEDLAAGKFTK